MKRSISSVSGPLEKIRVGTALQGATTLLICVLVLAYTSIPYGVFVIAGPLILMFFVRNGSIGAAVSLILGACLGAFLSIILIRVFVDSRFLYVLGTIMTVSGLAYWASQGVRGRWRYPFSAVMALLVLVTSAFSALSGAQTAEYMALQWIELVAVGTLSTALVWTVLLPSPWPQDFANLWSGVSHDCGRLLEGISTRIAANQPVPYQTSPVSLVLFGSLSQLIETHRKKLERSHVSYNALRRTLGQLKRVYIGARLLARTLEHFPQDRWTDELRQDVIALLEGLAGRLRALGRAMETGAGLPEAGPDLADRLEALKKRLRAKRGNTGLPSAKLTAFAAIAGNLKHELDGFSTGPSVWAVPDTDTAFELDPPPATKESPFQNDSIKQTIRVTVAITLAMLVHLIPDFPAGAYMLVGPIIVLAQPNLGKAHLRIRLWFPGVMAGTLYSLLGLAVIGLLPHFILLFLLLTLGFLIGCYVAAGSERVSYAGVQFCASVAIILGMVSFPIGNVISAEERVLGATIGFAIAITLAHLMWREHPIAHLREGLADALRHSATLLDGLASAKDLESRTRRSEVHHLGVTVQNNFALLYDFSYMLTKRLRHRLDYPGVTHALARLYAQIVSLDDCLSQIGGSAARRRAKQPLAFTQPRLETLLTTLADQIDRTKGDANADVEAQARQLAGDLDDWAKEAAKGRSGRDGWTHRVVIGSIHEILNEISAIAVGLRETDRPLPMSRSESLATGGPRMATEDAR